jgi:sugar phosphate isomerase/epimerase
MLGVQLYSVRDRLAADRDATLRRVAELGYQAVEWFNPTDDPAGLRTLADRYGLTVWSTHAPLLDDPDAILDAATAVGTDTVVVPWLDPARFADRAAVEQTARRLNDAAKRAAERGIAVGYHNHWFEPEQRVDGRPALEVLADALDDEVFLEVDVYWATVGGLDVPALLGRLGERVRYLHVKDGPATTPEAAMTAVGAGTLDIPAILAAAPQARRIVELDRCDTDMFTALADSIGYLRGVAS